MVTFRCSDIGMDCPFEASSETLYELPRKIIDHIHDTHKGEAINPDLLMRIKNTIKA